MYSMEIRGVTIVLRSEWLASIRTIGLDIQKKFLRFYKKGKKYKFHGIDNLSSQIVSSNKMKKNILKGAQYYLLHCYSMEKVYDETKYPKGLDNMLDKYNIIFQDLPHGLPLVGREIIS